MAKPNSKVKPKAKAKAKAKDKAKDKDKDKDKDKANPTVRPELRLTCPICKKTGPWFDAPSFPFCSSRCKNVDLGNWFNEEYVISEPLRPDHFEEFADIDLGPDGPHERES